MKQVFAIALLAALGAAVPALAIEPIPGSITYHGQPRTKLQKAPIGSQVQHGFFGEDGYRYEETYIIQPDRSLKLVDRQMLEVPGD